MIKIAALIILFSAIIFMTVVGDYTPQFFQENKSLWSLLLSSVIILSLFLYGYIGVKESKKNNGREDGYL